MTYLHSIPEIDLSLRAALLAKLDGKAKPLGALGRIEALSLQLGLIQQRLDPEIDRALLFIFAGDHGLTQDGVSSFPQSVTVALVHTFLAGRATANAFANVVGAQVRVVDAGVAAELAPHPALIGAKIAMGTRNAAVEPAMTAAALNAALTAGAAMAASAADENFDVIALGEMGIGNTASAALIMHRLTGIALSNCVGRGAGHDDAGLAHKLAVLERAAARSDAKTPMDVLTEFGGYEIAMMAGAVLGAAAARMPVIVDGFIATAAALAAIRMAPTALPYCIFAHRSAEAGHGLLLQAIGAEPLLDLALRLGEGTGGLLCIPLLRAAARLLTEVASLDDVLSGNL